MSRREKLALRFLVKYLILTAGMSLGVLASMTVYNSGDDLWWLVTAATALAYFVLVMFEAKRFVDAVERV